VTTDGVTILAHEAIPSCEIDLAAVSARREELAGSEAAAADASPGDTAPAEQEIAFLDVQKKLGAYHE
jgi:F0F1-type ATP synthase epsilon subunit